MDVLQEFAATALQSALGFFLGVFIYSTVVEKLPKRGKHHERSR